jgi:enoyl-CoA hydratase/carnithine racemase
MITTERRNDGVALLVLDRPTARNALSLAMLEGLSSALHEAEDARCVVLAANGPAFCAGHDLREITLAREAADGGHAFFTRIMALSSQVMRQVVEHPVPVIAAVEGVATAAGCQLVASCDMAVAAPHARFSTPGVDIGLFCSTPAVALSRAVPRKVAMDMLLTGCTVEAKEAHSLGLISRVAEDARQAALDLASEVAARSAVTIRMGKRSFLAQEGQPLQAAYDSAAAVMVQNLLAQDAAEGIGAFLEKRNPHWQDR